MPYSQVSAERRGANLGHPVDSIALAQLGLREEFRREDTSRDSLRESAETKTDVKSPLAARSALDLAPSFCKYGNMQNATTKKNTEQVARYADMFSAMGTEARLRIMQLLLSAHPEGLVVGEIQEELDIPNSTLSHHLDKLRSEGLVEVRRESTFLRYTANAEALREILQFLYAECCTRNRAVKPREIVQLCK